MSSRVPGNHYVTAWKCFFFFFKIFIFRGVFAFQGDRGFQLLSWLLVSGSREKIIKDTECLKTFFFFSLFVLLHLCERVCPQMLADAAHVTARMCRSERNLRGQPSLSTMGEACLFVV